ncbi:MAG: hypothetical protein Q9162_000928 [Coniocarpon cinnabarinum]
MENSYSFDWSLAVKDESEYSVVAAFPAAQVVYYDFFEGHRDLKNILINVVGNQLGVIEEARMGPLLEILPLFAVDILKAQARKASKASKKGPQAPRSVTTGKPPINEIVAKAVALTAPVPKNG